MAVGESVSNVKRWQTDLGLLPVPLFGEESLESKYVLLNGSEGNFCLDLGVEPALELSRGYAWSANVSHYVTVGQSEVRAQRWDAKEPLVWSLRNVERNVEQFYQEIRKDPPRLRRSIVSHVIRVFRQLRALPYVGFNGPRSLKAFLYLLACATIGQRDPNLALWGLNSDVTEVARLIRPGDWEAMIKKLREPELGLQLEPDLKLVLRHAAGELFQEAHYEAAVLDTEQATIEGFLPSPVDLRKRAAAHGIHFTPPALARTLVEEAIRLVDLTRPELVIFDPACGSGEFLREALRQLGLRDYLGRIKVVGWDISPAACDMARFVIAWEKRRVPCDAEVRCVDSLDPSVQWPCVDMILMNPPFISWGGMNAKQRLLVEQALGRLVRKRPNTAQAFLWRASQSLRKGGVVATVLPASLLGSESAGKLRKELGERLQASLVARLGSHLLFPAAVVDVALYVGSRGAPRATPPVAFWSDHRTDSTHEGLRWLRKVRSAGTGTTLPIDKPGVSIYRSPKLGQRGQSWTPRSYRSVSLLSRLQSLPTVEDLFWVHQGAITGCNRAFLISRAEWASLPLPEQRFLRPAVYGSAISLGVLVDDHYVFYPYGKHSIDSEEDLRKHVPTYAQKHLVPMQKRLMRRARVGGAWWKLTWPRTWQFAPVGKLVSKRWGGPGSFAWDSKGLYVVVQGHAWLPKSRPCPSAQSSEVGQAYLALLNSDLFAELLPAFSNNLSGGQWNLSPRFVNSIPVPDLMGGPEKVPLVSALATVGRQLADGRAPDYDRWDLLVREAYGIKAGLHE